MITDSYVVKQMTTMLVLLLLLLMMMRMTAILHQSTALVSSFDERLLRCSKIFTNSVLLVNPNTNAITLIE